MPNLKGYLPLPDPNWIRLEFEDGTLSNPVQDPDGSYRSQVDEIARKVKGIPPDPMQGALASVGGELTEGAGSALARTASDAAPNLTLSPRRGVQAAFEAPPTPPPAAAKGVGGAPPGLKTALRPMPGPGMPPGTGENASAPPAGSEPPPAATPPASTGARAPGLVATETTSSWQKSENRNRQTSGMAEEDRKKVDAANEATASALGEANVADYAAKANQFWNDWTRLSEEGKRQVAERAALQEQERRYDESLNGAYKRLDETAARPVDPSQAFAGEKGWYAFMAGFGDVLRNVGSALAGQRPVADPGATLDALVERSVNLQMAQKKADYEAGRISVDRLTADRETVRHRLGVVLSQLADTELKKAQTKTDYAALGAIKAKGDAIVADARAKAAAATARQETLTEGTTKASGGTTTRGIPKPTGADSLDNMSKMLDIEKKRIELENAQTDRLDAAEASKILGRQVSPDRLEKIRTSLKDNAPAMAKLDSFMSALQDQLRINGATFDRNTGDIKWGKDVDGVGYVKLHQLGPGGQALAEAFNTKALQLENQQKFLGQLVTNDVTGAVSTLQQDEVFKQATGGAGRNPDQYKQALEHLAKFAVERRNGLLTPLGEDGIKLYRHNEQQARRGLAPSATPIGTLPEGRR